MQLRAAFAAMLGGLSATLACGHVLELVDSPPGDSDAGDADSSRPMPDDGGADGDADSRGDGGPSVRCTGTQFTDLIPLAYPAGVRAVRSVGTTSYFGSGTRLVARSNIAGVETERAWMGALNGASAADIPAVSADQRRILYEIPGAGGLRYSERSSAEIAFELPVPVDTTFGSETLEGYEPSIVEDGPVVYVYFVAGQLGSARRLYEGRLESNVAMGSPAIVDIKQLQSLAGSSVGFPVVSPGRLEIFFTDGADTVPRLKRAMRTQVTDEFDSPTDITLHGVPGSSPLRETRASWLSPDGCELIVTCGVGDPSVFKTTRAH